MNSVRGSPGAAEGHSTSPGACRGGTTTSTLGEIQRRGALAVEQRPRPLVAAARGGDQERMGAPAAGSTLAMGVRKPDLRPRAAGGGRKGDGRQSAAQRCADAVAAPGAQDARVMCAAPRRSGDRAGSSASTARSAASRLCDSADRPPEGRADLTLINAGAQLCCNHVVRTRCHGGCSAERGDQLQRSLRLSRRHPRRAGQGGLHRRRRLPGDAGQRRSGRADLAERLGEPAAHLRVPGPAGPGVDLFPGRRAPGSAPEQRRRPVAGRAGGLPARDLQLPADRRILRLGEPGARPGPPRRGLPGR